MRKHKLTPKWGQPNNDQDDSDDSQVFRKMKKLSTRKASRLGLSSSHKGQQIQAWIQDQTIQALTYYFDMWAPGYSGKSWYKVVADEYRIPRKTFRRRKKGRLVGLVGHLIGGKNQLRIFTEDEEKELARHISKFAQTGFPFMPTEIRRLAFEYVEVNEIKGFNLGSRKVARKWLGCFMDRHKGLTL